MQELLSSGVFFPAFWTDHDLCAIVPMRADPGPTPDPYVAIMANPEFKPQTVVNVLNLTTGLGVTPAAHLPIYVDILGNVLKTTNVPPGRIKRSKLYEAFSADSLGGLEALQRVLMDHPNWAFRLLTKSKMTVEDLKGLITQVNEIHGLLEPRASKFIVVYPQPSGPAKRGEYDFDRWTRAQANLTRFISGRAA